MTISVIVVRLFLLCFLTFSVIVYDIVCELLLLMFFYLFFKFVFLKHDIF